MTELGAEPVTYLVPFFHEASLLLERPTNYTFFRIKYLMDVFLSFNESVEPVTSRKTTDCICCQWETLNFQEKMRILENVFLPLGASQLPYTDFPD